MYPFKARPNCLCVYLVLFFAGLLCGPAHAQFGFQLFNQRNHPELKWEVIETEHFKIIYHQWLEQTASQAAAIAEASYGPITANLEFHPSSKVPIYISDQDEIANGYDLGSSYIAIWVNVNHYLDWSTGEDKWLRKVIAHELVHYIHFSAIRTWLGFLGEGLSGTPRWFAEGVAQYESETWNLHRGDHTLRTAVMDDEMDFLSGRFPSDGALLYASGNSMVRYLADTYGDDKLVQILKHRSRKIIPYYSFGNAFRKAINKSVYDFYREWRRHVNVYYNSFHAQKEDIVEIGKKMSLPLNYIYGFRIAPDSAFAALSGFRDMNDRLPRLWIMKLDSTRKIRILEHNSVHPNFAWSPDGKQIAYAKTRRGKHGSLIPDVYISSLKGEKRRLTSDLRASDPDWSPCGKFIVCVVNDQGTANLIKIAIESGDISPLTRFAGDVQVRQPRWSPDGEWIAFVLSDSPGNRDIAAISSDGSRFTKITDDSLDDRNPCWSPDAFEIAYTSYTGITGNIVKKRLGESPREWASEPAIQLTDVGDALYLMEWAGNILGDSRRDSLIVSTNRTRYQTELFKLPANRSPQISALQIKPRFESWQTHLPPNGLPPFRVQPDADISIEKLYPYRSWRHINHFATIPLPTVSNETYGLGLVTFWGEPLGKHTFLGIGEIFPTAASHSRWIVSYLNNQWHPTFALSSFYFPLSAQIFDDELLFEEERGVALQAFWHFNRGDDLLSNHTLVSDLTWAINEPVDIQRFAQSEFKPQMKRIGEIGLEYRWKRLYPNRQNQIHPRNGCGVKLRLALSDRAWHSELTYQRYEGELFCNLPIPLMDHVLYLQTKVQAVQGDQLTQRSIGFDKYDQLDFGLGLPLGERDRLRGIHEYMLGDRLLMLNAEYRFSILSDLGWVVAGCRFGRITGAFFSDNGAAWRRHEIPFRKVAFKNTIGFELKNRLSVAGLSFVHSLGWAQQLTNENADTEVYYRIRSVMPF
ncbi:PD40 domain-containing protein [candidate division KSB1 bacterium]|nr:PD40 domain-containing protein [candidate division KSB1 bacterium]